MLTHTPAIQGHTAPGAHFSPRCSPHLDSPLLAELPKALPTSPYTRPELRRHTQAASQTLALRVHHRDRTSRPPTWIPTATALHTLCTHTRITVTHADSHTRSLKTVTVSHMDAIPHLEQSIFHIDTIAPSETQSPPATLSLSCSHIQQWEIQRYTLTTVIPCWDLGLPRLHSEGWRLKLRVA